MKSFVEQARFYLEYHQTSNTRYSHFVGIPLVVFSSMIFLGFIHLLVPGVFNLSMATIATLALLIYYFLLNWQLSLVLTPVFLILLWIANKISQSGPTHGALWIFFITFILGWSLQLLGHFLEEKKPSFMNNYRQTLIAPLFLTAELIFKSGHLQELKKQIYEFDESDNLIKKH